MEKFIGAFSAFLGVQSALFAEFDDVWLECDSALVSTTFTARQIFSGYFKIDGILVLIMVKKSGLGLLIFS